jgi:hypothetical protein
MLQSGMSDQGRASERKVAVVRDVAGNRRMTRRRSSVLGGVIAARGSAQNGVQ